MTDRISRSERSRIMARVSGKDTHPELAIRSLLHQMGHRFRLHRRDLPGKPDIVLPKHRKMIFVHGCFWHGHEGCLRSRRPTTNVDFWNRKLDGNIVRDALVMSEIRSSGWKALVIWECETKVPTKLKTKLRRFLRDTKPSRLCPRS